MALPVLAASPVGPELPVFPVLVWTVVWVLAGGAVVGGVVVVVVAASAAGPSSRMAAAATPVAPARQAAPATRTLFPLVMFMSLA